MQNFNKIKMPQILNFRLWLIIYTLSTIILGSIARPLFPDKTLFIFQTIFILNICIFAYILFYKSLKRSVFFTSLFIFQIVWIAIFRIFNQTFYGNPLGYNPLDASFYNNLGVLFSSPNYLDLSLSKLLSHYTQGMDDWGFPTIVAISYKTFGAEFGITFVAILNAVFVIIGTIFIHKIARRFTTDTNARAICFIWATLPFSIYTSSVGLKENYMVCFVILSIYHLYQYMEHPNLKSIILFFLFTITLLFFRTAIFFILMITFFFTLCLTNKSFAKNVNRWLLFFAFLSFVFFSYAVDFIGGIRGDVDSSTIGQQAENLISQRSSIVVYSTNILATIIGPFPSFISDPIKVNYITIYSFGTMVKMLLSIYYIYGIIYIVKHKITYFYPLLIFIALHSIMLITTFYSLHDRYQWPQIPFVLLLSLFGFLRLKQVGKLKTKFIVGLCPLLFLAFILVYNLRLA